MGLLTRDGTVRSSYLLRTTSGITSTETVFYFFIIILCFFTILTTNVGEF